MAVLDRFPFGVQIRARVSGFSAIYALSIIGCLFIFGITSWIFPEGQLKDIIIIASLGGFFVLLVLGCCVGLLKSNVFSIKEEYRTIIQLEGLKKLGEEPMEITEQIGTPTSPVQMEQPKKKKDN